MTEPAAADGDPSGTAGRPSAGGRLAGRVAVVTGASQGIGREIARAFAREGARVVAGARSAEGLAATSEGYDGRVVPQICDVRDESEVERLIGTAVERFGRLDVLCNNAGVLRQSRLEETSRELWDEVLETNVRGTFFGCKHAIPAMRRTGRGGSIINLGSINSYVGETLHTAYVTSKGAVLMLTRNAAAECAPDGIRVNMIAPGTTDTPMNDSYFEALGGREQGERWMTTYQPLVGMIPPGDIARVAVFLASDDSRSMTGASLLVDGGLMASWDHFQ